MQGAQVLRIHLFPIFYHAEQFYFMQIFESWNYIYVCLSLPFPPHPLLGIFI